MNNVRNCSSSSSRGMPTIKWEGLLPLLSAHDRIFAIVETSPRRYLQEIITEMYASATYTPRTLAGDRDKARPALEKVATH